ncbi:hypothetical protein DPMN_071358 [Dreissena polymorpha]|uniref:Uncharacterized protein n=1 Tax=Dreissena polymorpha TaxID=45954 RepID=A0A9D3Z6K2_DREPO|nr:hypothetical protein DPMN_071358 [Dreissena polymorpha]
MTLCTVKGFNAGAMAQMSNMGMLQGGRLGPYDSMVLHLSVNVYLELCQQVSQCQMFLW